MLILFYEMSMKWLRFKLFKIAYVIFHTPLDSRECVNVI